MTTWIVSRHPGAIEWLARRGFGAGHHVAHLDPARPAKGDTVVGTLPVPLIARLTERGVDYLHLTIPVPAERRGTELSADELEHLGACLQRFAAKRIPVP
ncbi:hypothetical protein KBTX_03424 [wastewater metagenome]|uniref:CRISPR-associated protein Csx16 n=2 Tax=unclassified sequences TaxID=12908 RepID=A0A5B8RDG2_9ZZZZ|nr:CRISPR-associated protein Csx16 [Arhodomonas sp. KWT]QEA07079.1 hypothetical protein KBTEX_03424 [uncultured organism]